MICDLLESTYDFADAPRPDHSGALMPAEVSVMRSCMQAMMQAEIRGFPPGCTAGRSNNASDNRGAVSLLQRRGAALPPPLPLHSSTNSRIEIIAAEILVFGCLVHG